MKDNKLTKEQQTACIEAIKHYFLTEKDELITDLSATLLLDFIWEMIGPHIYNQAIKDTHFLMSQKIEDLFVLEKPIKALTSKR
ncbi:DUF2164 domain-containing protein [Sporomusa termitida]|uniref:DUF2164 domain-containing protein n=1 Tax=Sporomusa termitida TaxID=2377 RepID=A0A517DSS3_9FIRM|nr:DUF2164 domain-containing protein [Sporomusa termitida]QDR80403.1 hypothetical protein SPTER_17260 [Sporomusa termitida]